MIKNNKGALMYKKIMIGFILLIFSHVTMGEDKVMRLVYADYKPYSFFNENGQVTGFEIDILTEALQQRMGIKVTHEILPWNRAQRLVENGGADAFIATLTDKRKSYAIPSDTAITHFVFSAFTRENHKTIDISKKYTIDELKAFKIGAIMGNGWVEKNFADHDVYYIRDMDLLVKFLLGKRVDMIVDNTYFTNHYLKTQKLKNDVISLNSVNKKSAMPLLISKKSTFLSIMPEFNHIIKIMKDEGFLEKAHQRYQ